MQSFFLRFSLLLILSLSFIQCSDNKAESLNNSSEFSNVVQAYGPRSLSKYDNIFIEIKPQYAAKIILVEDLNKFCSISPKIKGDFLLRNNQMIVFNPEEELKSGTSYSVSVDFNGLLQDSTLPKVPFQFPVSVLPQQVSISIKDYFYENNHWNLDVQMKLNDKESINKLSESISVKQGNEDLPFTIETSNPYKPVITILDVKSNGKNNKIAIQVLGKSLGLKENKNLNFTLPDSNAFILLKSKENKEKETVEFIFSQLLDKSQNLDGLIRLKKNKKTPKYSIEDNKLIVFLANSNKDQILKLSPNIRSTGGIDLSTEVSHVIGKIELTPKLKNVGIGHIIPSSDKVIFPFEAIGLNSVRLEVFQVYSGNLHQFYQQNSLRNSYNLDYVGEVVYAEELNLSDLSDSFDPYEMSRYYFDVKDFISKDHNSIYQIRLGFIPEDIALDCGANIESLEDSETSIFDSGYYGLYGYYDGFDWKDQDDPCKKAFYNSRNYINKTVLSTNLGIIAKKSENGDLSVFVNDIISTSPISGVQVEVFNKAQKNIGSTKTDKEGLASLTNVDQAFMLRVSKNNTENWLRIRDNDALEISKFDVNGRNQEAGIDGFIYSERNVWRPGDSLFVDFMLFDPDQIIPNNHPVKIILENPNGAKVFEEVSTSNYGPIYSFNIPTKTNYLTGDYLLKAKVGSSNFTKFIKIENIKPNKFAIASNLPKSELSRSNLSSSGIPIEYQVSWLYGAPAKEKKVTVELDIDKSATKFEGFNNYVFTNPRYSWNRPSRKVVADVKTDEQGKVDVNLKLPSDFRPPGKVRLKLKTTAYESSGDFSVDQKSTIYSPYNTYFGISLPRDDYGGKRADRDEKAIIKIASVNSDGTPKKSSLKANIYKMERYWWWNSYDDNYDMTNMNAHVSQNVFELSTDSKGLVEIETTFNSYGRYFIQICDEELGHCTGDYLYVGYAWDDGEMTMNAYEEAAQLSFTAEKEEYKVGETVKLNIPSYFEGKALVSLENGTEVVESFWTKIERGNNTIPFTTQMTMFPTIYAHVTMLQAHDDKANDMPIRSYGILPIKINDNSLELSPQISTSESIKPKEAYQVEVSEKSGNGMYYTLSIVDEGLLNLSNFKTPDPFNYFYSKPSLGVRTYDMYNEVMTAYGKELDQLFSIGGDLEIVALEKDSRANRFAPVVQHVGPFYLPPGKKTKHDFVMPNYIGAVRIMVVAGKDRAFGSQEKVVPVKQDLMIMATLPRQLSPGDQLDVPITMISMKDGGVGEVTYGVNSESNKVVFSTNSDKIDNLNTDEEMRMLEAKVLNSEGKEVLDFYAKSRNITSSHKIEIQVENPNPIIRKFENIFLDIGANVDLNLTPIGVNNSNYTVSVSSLSPINIESHIDALARYPYGCLEQRTSAAFAMLYQDDLIDVDETQRLRAKTIVEDLLNDLYRFKKSNGYGLWPGNLNYNSWLTSYIGEFLIDAKEKGFSVPKSDFDAWIQDQKSLASNWSIAPKTTDYNKNRAVYNQSYRLYTLARSGNAMLNEMNRLKEDFTLNRDQALILSAAYAEAGRSDIANTVIAQAQDDSKYYRYSFGSKVRNMALKSIMYEKIGQKDKMATAIVDLNKQLAKNDYLSTQSAAFVLRALAMLNKSKSASIQVQIKQDSNTAQTLSSEQSSMNVDGELTNVTKMSITNTSDQPLYIQSVITGKEALGNEGSNKSNLNIKTVYKNMDGKVIVPSELSQGTDFQMQTTVSKDQSLDDKNFDNLVLRQIVPAGWEITNDRIFSNQSTSVKGLDYQDFLDNKVHSFFSLENKSKIVISIQLKATYLGDYFHPKLLVESMYENDIFAEEKGFSVKVIR